jgi:hypothetical protein
MKVKFEAYWSIGAQEIQPRISRMTRMGGTGRVQDWLKADRGVRLPYFQGAGTATSDGYDVFKAASMAELRARSGYLSHTGLRLGLLLNFKHAKLQWKRIVN